MVSSALRWKKKTSHNRGLEKVFMLYRAGHTHSRATVFFSISLCLHLHNLFKFNSSTGRTNTKTNTKY